MMKLLKLVKVSAFSGIFLSLALSSCMTFDPNEIYGVKNVAITKRTSKQKDPSVLLDWLKFRPDRVTALSLPGNVGVIAGDHDRSRLALGFGLEKAQALDAGVYGKLGKSTVFVAHRKNIPDYDRLYWVMVRVLSEKYGCFIKRKFPRDNQIGFECRDRRTIVMQRDISGDYAKFVGWQFDSSGKEVVITQEARMKQERFNRAKLRSQLP